MNPKPFIAIVAVFAVAAAMAVWLAIPSRDAGNRDFREPRFLAHTAHTDGNPHDQPAAANVENMPVARALVAPGVPSPVSTFPRKSPIPPAGTPEPFDTQSPPPEPPTPREAYEQWQSSPGVRSWSPDIPLERRAVVAGRVIHADGRPATGATVEVRHPVEELSTSLPILVAVGPDGSFRHEWVFPGPARVEATLPGFRPAVEYLVLGEAELRELVLVVARGNVLEGRVLDPEGGPVAGASILLGTPGQPLGMFNGSADTQGNFKIAGIDDLKGWIARAWADDFALGYSTPFNLAGGNDRAWVEVVLRPGRNLRVVALGPGDLPLTGARIYVDHEGRRWGQRTDDSGETLVRGLPILDDSAVIRVWASAEGCKDLYFDLPPTQDEDLVLRMAAR